MAFVEPTSKRIIGFAEQREGLNLDLIVELNEMTL
jgi:hypothetical protein